MAFTLWVILVICFSSYIIHRIRIAPKEDDTIENNIRRQSKLLLFIGGGGYAFCGIVGAINILTEGIQMTSLAYIFACFALLCYSMMLAYANWRIEYLEDGFSYHTFLGNMSQYRYDHIVEYLSGADTFVFYMNDGKKVYIERMDAHIFVELLEKANEVRGRGKGIKEKKVTLLGQGMQANAIIFLVVFALFSVSGVALFLTMNTDAPFHIENVEQVSVSFASLHREGDRQSYTIISAKDGGRYYLSSINDGAFAKEDFQTNVKAGDTLLLTIEKNRTDSDGLLYIVAIQSQDQVYLRMEDSNQLEIDNAILGKWIGIGLTLLGSFGMYLIIYLIKHPTRFPKLQKEFFGEKYGRFRA